ncbi:heparinase II/III-family protein [Pseudomonas sp. NFACC39-1]|uniref:heparinase II/III family protein n=1 Tax=Pseudomonas sp. NFACC39-1 TaxID=1566195 RepID=UPI0008B84A1E|nr:heparinase II/III-family protein [Pseudomonas sp. NFACC39-1]SEO25604.1 Heparinase II/III-like protein [Pseudomonas sp. NFACC39-1]
MKAVTKITTYFSLGLINISKVTLYRLKLRLGVSKIRRIQASVQTAPFFKEVSKIDAIVLASDAWRNEAHIFGRRKYCLEDMVPSWHCNPLTGLCATNANTDWWRIPDFDPVVGDIKAIWEASRFDWVLPFAQRAKAGEDDSLVRLNRWLADWCEQNKPYKGVNWKCGQEASIRVMHLAMAAIILEQIDEPCKSLLDLIALHLKRIEPTIDYAIAQDNNHGTSEAAALYIGGSWLKAQGIPEGGRWLRLGRKWLENRAARLIGVDGSFSQYSLNYHRVLLDTFCMVEVWRRQLQLPQFSPKWYTRSLAASEWLRAMINPLNGDGPNLGANDGARLLQLTDTDYRDFRPTVQLAMALFADVRAYADEGSWNLPLRWLGLELPQTIAPSPDSRLFHDGGFAVLRRGSAMAMLRYPRFRFRPSQADALHVDLWLSGRNLLRDAGTYSYNTDVQWLNYFPGTASHNTVQFDDRDQMPRLSRFLFGDWLRTSCMEPLSEVGDTITFVVGYQDGRKARHQRDVRLTENTLRVIDKIEGFAKKAVLRWRLEPGEWRVEGYSLCNGDHTLTLKASMPIARFELVEGWESRYYLGKEQTPVLEIEVHQPGSLITEYRWVL